MFCQVQHKSAASYENSSSFSRLRSSGVRVSFSGDGLRRRPLSHSEITRVRIQSVMGRTSDETVNDASQKTSPPSVRCHRPWQRQAPTQWPTTTARTTSRAYCTCTFLFRTYLSSPSLIPQTLYLLNERRQAFLTPPCIHAAFLRTRIPQVILTCGIDEILLQTTKRDSTPDYSVKL